MVEELGREGQSLEAGTSNEGQTQDEPKALSEVERIEQAWEAKFKAETSGRDRQISLLSQEKNKFKGEAEQQSGMVKHLQDRLRDAEEAMEKALSDDPDARKAFKDRRAIAERELKAAQKEAEVDRKAYELWVSDMSNFANRMHTEYGVPMEQLETCETKESMELAGLKYQLANPKKGTTPAPKREGEPQKFASSVPSGGGMSEDEFMKQYATGKSNDHKRALDIMNKHKKGG